MSIFNKILLAHNYYNSSIPSGEAAVYALEKDLLLRRGHKVRFYERSNDELLGNRVVGAIKAGISNPYNISTFLEVQSIVKDFTPDIVHAHNLFPLISPAFFFGVGHRSPKVITLHNYRLFCSAATLMKGGEVCTRCLDQHSSKPALFHGCYRNSRLATVPVAASISLHRFLRTWERKVDAFIVLSEFQQTLMVSAGLPSEKVHIKPHFLPTPPQPTLFDERGSHGVFVGRLSNEKGIRTLVKAWRLWGAGAPELRIIGDGVLRAELEALSAGLPIRFLGQLPPEGARQEIDCAKMLILPSECIETFGLVILEAKAHGTAVIVSDEGPLPDFVQEGPTGWVFRARDSIHLERTLRQIWAQPAELQRLGQRGRIEFEKNYTEDKNYEVLLEIYDRARFNFRNSRP